MKKSIIKGIVLLVVLAGVGALIFESVNFNRIVIEEAFYNPTKNIVTLHARYGGLRTKECFATIQHDFIRQGAEITAVTPIPDENNQVKLEANKAGILVLPAGVHIVGEINGQAFSLDITPGAEYSGVYKEEDESFRIDFEGLWISAEGD